MSYNLQVICDDCGEVTDLRAKTVLDCLALTLEWGNRIDAMMQNGADYATKIQTRCPACAAKTPMAPNEMRTNGRVTVGGDAIKKPD